MAETLSPQQARKLVLLAQRLPQTRQAGSAAAATLSAIEHLGYVQIDTISVVQRAHHHTLWNRNPRYQTSHLDQLIDAGQVFEYWSHAAAYLPMRDFRHSLPRKLAIASGAQDHWYERDKPLMKAVLERITAEGPLMARDFENPGSKTGDWDSKPAKRALEYLFMQGELMAPRRVNFHKVYDLTERVLPAGINTAPPDSREHARFLILRYLRANGLGQPGEIGYLLKGMKPLIAATLQDMLAGGEVLEVEVAGRCYHALPSALALLNKPLARSRLTILSPFDNLLIQRKRMQALFSYDYQIECYLPAARRQFGYFSLPVLWNGELLARMDCKADRGAATLHVQHLVAEPGLRNTDAFREAWRREIPRFMQFNDCINLRLHKTTPPGLRGALPTTIDNLGYAKGGPQKGTDLF